jgi:hypothetical protein
MISSGLKMRRHLSLMVSKIQNELLTETKRLVVAEDIDVQLSKYREDAASVTKQTGVNSLEELDTSASAQHLKTALTLLPELRERKVRSNISESCGNEANSSRQYWTCT